LIILKSLEEPIEEKSKGNLGGFIIQGCDEKPWLISGMEDGMSISFFLLPN